MLLHTHLQLSKLIRQGVEAHTSIWLDLAGFAFGNIKPDLIRDFHMACTDDDRVKVCHYMDDAFPYICTLIDELVNSAGAKSLSSRGASKLFSIRLGVIMHYISDFFCHAHSPKFVDTPISHHLYEWQFANYLSRHFPDYMDIRKAGLLPIHTDYYDIVASIYDIQNQYLDRRPSYSLDAQYALKCCIATAVSIIQLCNLHIERQAA